jgi:hypothetical protein
MLTFALLDLEFLRVLHGGDAVAPLLRALGLALLDLLHRRLQLACSQMMSKQKNDSRQRKVPDFITHCTGRG